MWLNSPDLREVFPSTTMPDVVDSCRGRGRRKLTKVCGYLRCSTETQDDSLETQEQIIRDWCVREGHELVEYYRDFGISAGVPVEKRPGGYELFAAVAEKKRAFEGIVVVRVDRLFGEPDDEIAVLVFLDEH